MSHTHSHLSDRDLILAADGELSRRRKAEIAAHLESCWTCRERRMSLEFTISEFVRARNASLLGQIPDAAGPRASLRARLAEEVRTNGGGRMSVWRRLWPAAVFAVVLMAAAIVARSTLGAAGLKPRPDLTPGETRPITIAEVCRSPRAEVLSDIPEETKARVLLAYGIHAPPRDFEVDYLITPDLGGARTDRNLWPQPYRSHWNAHKKDELEQRLHNLVCNGQLDLPTAQHEIATNWIGAYKKYVAAVVR